MRAARLLIGAAALLRGVVAAGILRGVLRPDAVHLPFAPWIPRPPVSVVPWIVAVWLALAVGVTIGWRLRWTATALALLIAGTLLFDQQTYSNHLYLLAILLAMLGLTRDPRPWLRAQLTVVYGCAALVKLNPSYLSGSVFLLYLAPWVPSQVKRFDVLAPLAVLSVVAELFLAIAFWVHGVRRLPGPGVRQSPRAKR